MDLALIGLELSGKTTLFRAVTRGHAASASYGALEPVIGVVKVPDDRLDRLSTLLKSRKVTHLELRWLDFPGSLSLRGDVPPAYLAALAQSDALVHVVRAFQDESAPHPQGTVDADRDIANVNLELAFGDAAALERRHERLDIAVRSARPGERESGERELALLQRLRAALEREEPLRAQELSADERRQISGYQLLTNKPLLVAVNAGEGDAGRLGEIESDLAQRWAGPGVEVVAVCAKLEQELAELSDEEALEFRRDMGLSEDGAGRLAQAAQRVLGQLAFFTVGETEGRAWTLNEGGTALEAAAKIHTDIARGFIRAEVIGWQEMLDCGSWPEARKRGLLRTEGKQYVVKDGELVNVLFNV
jgi:GTP-binding protein YchF